MKAILCKEYGPAEKLVIEEVPSPEVKGRGVKVRVKAAGLNFPDTLIIENKYQLKPSLPFSPGGEMAGEVIEVGDKVTRFKVGDRVAGLTGYGAFAEEVIVPEQNLLPVPDGMSDEKAAAFTMVYGTSYYALKQRGNLQPGESLLVLGASGGVGRALCEHIEQHLPQLTLCRLGRREPVRLDLLDDESLQHARDHVAALVAQQPLRL